MASQAPKSGGAGDIDLNSSAVDGGAVVDDDSLVKDGSELVNEEVKGKIVGDEGDSSFEKSIRAVSDGLERFDKVEVEDKKDIAVPIVVNAGGVEKGNVDSSGVHVVEQETPKKRGRGRPPKSATRKSIGSDGGIDKEDVSVGVEEEGTPKARGRGRTPKSGTEKSEGKKVKAKEKEKALGEEISGKRRRWKPSRFASGDENEKLEVLEMTEGKPEPTRENESNKEGENKGREKELSLTKKERARGTIVNQAPPHVSCLFLFQDEKKDGFGLSDLVWGKVRSHPWWPGQIFDSSCASKMALDMQKDGQFLVAYFGDKTFAWCDESHLKPFQMCFPQMEKQSYMDAFQAAVDDSVEEVRRRVQLAMTCSCNADEAHVDLLNQKIENAGIKEGTFASSGDGAWIIESFDPNQFMECLHTLAEFPNEGMGKLDVEIVYTQLNAFKHSKGYFEHSDLLMGGLPNEVDGSPAREENSALDALDPKTSQSTGKVKSKAEEESGLSGKQRHWITNGRKQKKLSELMKDSSHHCHESDEDIDLGGMAYSRSSRQKRKAPDPEFVFSGKSKKKKIDSLGDTKHTKMRSDSQTPAKKSSTWGKRWREDHVNESHYATENSGAIKALEEYALMNELLSDLCLGATDPLNEQSILFKIGCFLSAHKNWLANSSKMEDIEVEVAGSAGSKRKTADDQTPEKRSARVKRRRVDHVNEPHFETENSGTIKALEEYALMNEVVSDLCLGATDPLNKHSILFKLGHFSSAFRNWLVSSTKEEKHVEVDVAGSRQSRRKTTELHSTSTESTLKTTGYVQDSYWSDIILSEPKEETITKGQNGNGNSEGKQRKSNGRKAQKDGAVSDAVPTSPGTKQELKAENPLSNLQEVEECMPTELCLTFSDSYVLPSADDLVKIFCQYGPLREAETEVLVNENIARVVFRRRADAELALNGAGECSLFGQASVGYRLRNLEPAPK